MNLLTDLKPEVDALHGLLENPELGLLQWQIEVCRRWKKIADLWDPSGIQSANAVKAQAPVEPGEERQKQNE